MHDSKQMHMSTDTQQRRIQNPVKNAIWSFLRKHLTPEIR